MAQWLRAPATLAEDTGLIAALYSGSQLCVALVSGNLTPLPTFSDSVHGAQTRMQAKHSYAKVLGSEKEKKNNQNRNFCVSLAYMSAPRLSPQKASGCDLPVYQPCAAQPLLVQLYRDAAPSDLRVQPRDFDYSYKVLQLCLMTLTYIHCPSEMPQAWESIPLHTQPCEQ